MDIFPPGHFHSRTISPLFLHCVGHSSLPSPPYATLHSTGYSASFQKMPASWRLWSEPHFVGRLGSGVRVSARFQIFALTAGGNVLGGEGNCPGGECPGEYVRGGCAGGMSYTRRNSGARKLCLALYAFEMFNSEKMDHPTICLSGTWQAAECSGFWSHVRRFRDVMVT